MERANVDKEQHNVEDMAKRSRVIVSELLWQDEGKRLVARVS